jgi:hypothetical protein
MTLLGPCAEGNDGTDEDVFAAFMGENHTRLTPLGEVRLRTPPSEDVSVLRRVQPPARRVRANPQTHARRRLAVGPPRGSIDAFSSAVAPSRENGHQIPPDADTQGFVGYPGAGFNYTDPAVSSLRYRGAT